MKARTLGQRVVVLVSGAQLVPLADWVGISDVESKHPFTAKLVENGEIELSGDVLTTTDNTEQDTTLYDKLVEKSIEELRAMCDELEIDYKEGNNRPQLAKKLVEYEEQNQ